MPTLQFQSPSHRGRRLQPGDLSDAGRADLVSVPFSSGQAAAAPLSLHLPTLRLPFQSPSHRGRRLQLHECCGSGQRCVCFSPLLIGAGGCSLWKYWRTPGPRGVSVPFSSGQAAAANRNYRVAWTDRKFQSPSHRGRRLQPTNNNLAVTKSNVVSVPFSSGQAAAALYVVDGNLAASVFQSPSHRGRRLQRNPARV